MQRVCSAGQEVQIEDSRFGTSRAAAEPPSLQRNPERPSAGPFKWRAERPR